MSAKKMFGYLVNAYQKQHLESSYQRGLQLHTLKEKVENLEKQLFLIKKKGIDNTRAETLQQRIDEIKRLFP